MSVRMGYAIGVFAVLFLVGVSMYLQFYRGFVPCPLCTLQRAMFVCLGCLFALGWILYKKRRWRLIVDILCLASALLGIIFAGRQVWLQYLPSNNNGECGVSLQYMLQVLPIGTVLKKVFAGSTECAERGWEFLLLTMADWSLLFFGGFCLLSFYLLAKEYKRNVK